MYAKSLNNHLYRLTIGLFLIVFMGVVVSTTVGAVPALSDMPTSIKDFGENGSGNGQLSGPHGLAVDGKGNVYVVDNGNDRVQKFTSDGTYITQWGAAGSGNSQFDDPDGVATDAQDNIYVVDRGNNRVQKFKSDGTYITQWGSLGNANGQFNSPRGVAVDSKGYVYVADATNHRVQKFTANGTYVNQWLLPATDAQPDSMAVDPADTIYVADMSNNLILKYGSDGTLKSSWSTVDTAGTNPEVTPLGMAVGCYGEVYINQEVSSGWFTPPGGGYSITWSYQFQKYAQDGDYQGEYFMGGGGGSLSVLGIAVGSDCQVYTSYTPPTLYGQVGIYQYPTLPTTKSTLSSAPSVGKPVANAITIDTPAKTDLTCSSVAKVDASVPDSYHYPLGLVKYCFSTGNASNTVVITFVTDLKPSEVTPRKYNPITKRYTTISDALVTETTMNGKHALKLTYIVYDNGPLDIDPAIGAITDPVGLGTRDSVGVPDTGYLVGNIPGSTGYGAVVVGMVSLGMVVVLRRYAAKH